MAKGARNLEREDDYQICRTQLYDFEKNRYVYTPMLHTMPPGTIIRATVVALNQAEIAQESTQKSCANKV